MRHLRILVTDDETIIRLGLRRTLIGLGHEVRMAADVRAVELETALQTRQL